MKKTLTWIRRRAPYLVMVIVTALAFWIMSDSLNRTNSTAHTAKRTATHLAAVVNDLKTTNAELAGAINQINRVKAENNYQTCLKINKVQDSVVGVVDQTRQRSLLSLQATEASPAATAQQKIAAAKNYAGLAAFVQQLRNGLADSKCIVPT